MPGYLDILQNDPQASACTVDYGPNNSHKITLNIEPSDGRISVFQISYSQAPGMLNFNQNQQEGVFGEDTSPADWISTIPNPWVVTVGSHRTIITCFDINNFPSGTPLCSYDPTFIPFIDSAKFIDWNGNEVDCQINFMIQDGIESSISNKLQIKNPNLNGDFNGAIFSDSRDMGDNITEIGKNLPVEQKIYYSRKVSKPGIRFDNNALFNKLKSIKENKMKKIKKTIKNNPSSLNYGKNTKTTKKKIRPNVKKNNNGGTY